MSVNSTGVKAKQHERDKLARDVEEFLKDPKNSIKVLAPGESSPFTEADIRKRRAKIHNAKIRNGG